MKASIVLDTRKRNKDGMFPVSLRICDKYAMYFGTGFYGDETTFRGGEFTKKDPNYARKNVQIKRILNSTERLIIQLSDSITKVTGRELREMVNTEILGKEKKRKEKRFVDYIDEFIGTKQRKSTILLYTGTKKKILEYDGNATFDTMDARWLSDFERWLVESGLKTNSRSITFRNIRAVFNYAIDNEYTQLYPFRKFKIKREETRKRSLTVEQMRMFIDYPCEEQHKVYKDMFILMFCLIGINAIDLLTARKDALKNGRIEYKRAKTGKLYSIKVQPEAKEILDRYSGKEYLLDVTGENEDYEKFMYRMNYALRTIGERVKTEKGRKRKIKPLFPGLSSYWSRHTWATLAYELDIPVDVISQALGHSSPHPTTMIYIDPKLSKVDEANRKVLDYVFGKGI